MAQSFDLFINFDGNCREAVNFYAEVFHTKSEGLMTYGDAPPSEGYVTPEEDKDRILYCSLLIFGCNVMFCDCPPGNGFIKGNNICPTIGSDDKEEISRIFNALKQGGQVEMELQQTFWSDLYGMVADRYGIIWQLSHFKPQ